MRKRSQNESILDHLIEKKTINPLQALQLYGNLDYQLGYLISKKEVSISKNTQRKTDPQGKNMLFIL